MLVCAILIVLVPGPTPAYAQESPLVLAFYYAWYDQNTWTSGTTTDTPLEPYASADPAVIQRHVALAQSAGIDALVASWYGPQEANNQTETNFRVLLDAAAARGMRAGIAFETISPFFSDLGSVTEGLRYLLSVHAQHPAYLRYQGRPVIFFWRQQRFSVDTWAAIRAEVDPDRNSVWIAEGVDIAFQSVFDGHYLYSVAWSPDVSRTLSDWGGRVERYASQNNTSRLWVATVMPGYDDTRAGRGASAFAVSRRGGDYYRASWAAAAASQPDWVVITSFNEWVEGTMIEPSVSYGDLYLTLTRELGAQFKSAPPPVAAPTPAPTAEPPPTAEPEAEATTPTPVPTTAPSPVVVTPAGGAPQARSLGNLRIRSGPGTEFAILGLLPEGKSATVVGRTSDASWWEIEVPPEGTRTGWVSAEFVEVSGDVTGVPVTVEVTPAATATQTPTATATATSRPSATATATATSRPSATATATATSTPRPSATATATATSRPSATATATATATSRPSATATATSRPSATATAANTPTLTVSPTRPKPAATVTAMPATTPTVAATASPTQRAVAMATVEPTATRVTTPTRAPATATPPAPTATAMQAKATASATPRATATPVSTVTSSPTVKPSATSSPTVKPSATPSPTVKPSATPSPTVKPSATPSPTAKPSATPSPTAKPSATPSPTVKPSATSSPTVKPSATPSPTVKPSATPSPTAKPSATPSPTEPPTATTEPPTATSSPTAAPSDTPATVDEGTPGATVTVPPFITPLWAAEAEATATQSAATPETSPLATPSEPAAVAAATPESSPLTTPTAVVSPTPTSVFRLAPGNGSASVGGVSILLWLGLAALLTALGLALALKGRAR